MSVLLVPESDVDVYAFLLSSEITVMASAVSRFDFASKRQSMIQEVCHTHQTTEVQVPAYATIVVSVEDKLPKTSVAGAKIFVPRLRTERRYLHPIYRLNLCRDGDFAPQRPDSMRPYFVYDRSDDFTLSKIAKIISRQYAIGFAAVFDEQSALSGLQNLSYIVISTQSPSMTYVFDCVNVDPLSVLTAIRHVLVCPDIVKVVHDVLSTLGFFYQRHFIEMANVIDLHATDSVLRKKSDNSGKLVSLEELIQVYVRPSFEWPKKDEEQLQNSWDPVKTYGLDWIEADAALHGSFLLDILGAQQQRMIGSSVRRLGDDARKKLARIELE